MQDSMRTHAVRGKTKMLNAAAHAQAVPERNKAALRKNIHHASFPGATGSQSIPVRLRLKRHPPSMPLPMNGQCETGSRPWRIWVVGAIRLAANAVYLHAVHWNSDGQARFVLKNEFFIFNAFIHLLKTTRFIDSESFIKIENIFFQPPRHRTIVTGVPTLTVLKSGTQEERVMRMHPCDWGVWKTGPTCMPMPLSVSRMK